MSQFRTLEPEVFVTEERTEGEVRQHVQGHGQMLVEDPGLIRRVLPARVGVQGTAQGLQRQRQLARTPLPSTLEDHVLQEVAGTCHRFGVVRRTVPDPDIWQEAQVGAR